MKLSSDYPSDPGCYEIWEVDCEPFEVRVEVESDSHGLFYVLIPGDDHKYPLDLWQGALWFGPLSGSR
jgi:hypothetical protein